MIGLNMRHQTSTAANERGLLTTAQLSDRTPNSHNQLSAFDVTHLGSHRNVVIGGNGTATSPAIADYIFTHYRYAAAGGGQWKSVRAPNEGAARSIQYKNGLVQ